MKTEVKNKHMQKLIYFTFVVGTFALFVGCDDALDIENIYDYDAEKVWNDEDLANAFLVNLYSDVFGNWDVTLDEKTQQLSGIYWYSDRVTVTNDECKNWDYEKIRLINEAITNVNEGSLSQGVKDEITAQSFFMRAYTYFYMVVYHGGVPYITIPQDRYEDDLYVYRNTTAECFDSIQSDLDRAIELLPEQISPSDDDLRAD